MLNTQTWEDTPEKDMKIRLLTYLFQSIRNGKGYKLFEQNRECFLAMGPKKLRPRSVKSGGIDVSERGFSTF